MKEQYKIEVSKPCQENWNSFTETEKGGFCSNCQKEVIDFSQLTSTEIISVLSNNQSICGRFRKDQLGSHIIPQERRNSYNLSGLLRKGLVAGFLFLTQLPQNALAIKTATLQYSQNDSNQLNKKPSLSSAFKVSGYVVDEDTGEKLPSANVILKGTNIGVNTDLDGYFEFPQELKEGDVLIFTYIGMKRKEFKIKSNMGSEIILEMELIADIMGEVSISYDAHAMAPKPTIFQRIASWF